MILVNIKSLHTKLKERSQKELLRNFLKQVKHCFGQDKTQYSTTQDL